MRECKNCEYCDLFNNRCFNDDTICYKDGNCIHIGCKDYVEGKWTTQDIKVGANNGTDNQ